MADVGHWLGIWEGSPYLQPGQTHNWWFWHSSWDVYSLARLTMQLNVTAHPGVFGVYTPPPPVQLTVENIRSRINADYGRVLHFTVRNSGPNAVAFYFVAVTWIDS
jgi:hypothetical protein